MNNTDSPIQQLPSVQTPPENQTFSNNPITNQKGNFLIVLGVIFIILVVGIGGYLLGTRKSQPVISSTSKQPSPIAIVSPSPSQTQTPSPLATQITSSTDTFSHNFLPGFTFEYPKGWSLTTKPFGVKDPQGFTTTYFPTCHERCMGVQLSGVRNASLHLIFDAAFDDAGLKCSNRVDFTAVGNGWYRIKDSSGYFYSRNVELDETFGQSNFPPLGTISDEWSVVENTNYKICVHGNGNFLKQYSFVEAGLEGKGVPIMMEFPLIKGTPDSTSLKQIDPVVASIKGL